MTSDGPSAGCLYNDNNILSSATTKPFSNLGATYKTSPSVAISQQTNITNPIAFTTLGEAKCSCNYDNRYLIIVAGIVIGTLVINVVCWIVIWKFWQRKANHAILSASKESQKAEVPANRHYETVNDVPSYKNLGHPTVEAAYEL